MKPYRHPTIARIIVDDVIKPAIVIGTLVTIVLTLAGLLQFSPLVLW